LSEMNNYSPLKCPHTIAYAEIYGLHVKIDLFVYSPITTEINNFVNLKTF